MGKQETYWREFFTATDGSVVIGVGHTKEEAEQCATLNLIEYERVIHLPDKEQLKLILAGDLMDGDQIKALRLIGKILLKE
jgi:hypothetical protein